MRRWWVISPVYDATEDIIDGYRLTIPWRDCIEVIAENVDDARVCGLKLLRKEYGDHEWNCDNPFVDLLVQEADTVFSIT